MTKLDDASWHGGSDEFPPDVPEENAATHIGFFVAWAISRGHWNASGVAAAEHAVEAVKQGRMSGRSFLLQECDGKLFSSMLNDVGAKFANKYYPVHYVNDYQELFAKALESDYLVSDDPVNQDRIAALIDLRFTEWQARPWWRFW